MALVRSRQSAAYASLGLEKGGSQSAENHDHDDYDGHNGENLLARGAAGSFSFLSHPGMLPCDQGISGQMAF